VFCFANAKQRGEGSVPFASIKVKGDSMKNKIVFMCIVALTLAVGACGNANSQAGVGQDKAPYFKLDTADGGVFMLSDELKEKNAVLVFFATWCPYCVTEVPQVNELFSGKKDTVSVIGVNIQESKAKVESFIKAKNVKYPVAMDVDGKVAGLYKVRGIPSVVAVSKEGNILYKGSSIDEMIKKTGW